MNNYQKYIYTLLVFLCISITIKAQNPIVTHRYLADPGAFVYDGRVYIYASNDDENIIDEEGYEMTSIVAVSSSDLVNWTDHGIVFDVPEGASWAQYSWAPSPIERNGMFYLYFGNSGGGIGVARSNSPTGPFTDPIGGPLITTSTPGVLPADGIWLFDPMAFIDDDGQAYLYFGGNGEDNMRVIKLNEDMISVDGEATSFTVPNFFEASWMHKEDSVYYFSYSTDGSAGLRIDYMSSKSPMTDFTYGGILAPQPPNNSNNNNHHANFKFNGTWYHAYHNRIIAQQAGVLPTYRRSLNLDTFSHNGDGTINSVVHTSSGVSQVGTLNPYDLQEAETINTQNGIETRKDETGNLYVTDIENGDWIRVRGVDFGTTGASVFTAFVAADLKTGSATGGAIEIRLDSEDGTLVGTVPVSYTGGDESWKPETIAIDAVTGVQDVYFVFKGGEGPDLFNVDKWQFFENTGQNDLVALNATVSDSKIDTASGQNTLSISVNSIYADGTTSDITNEAEFTFDKEGIVQVNEGGVTGLNYDTVTVYATYQNVMDSTMIVVKNLDGEVTAVGLSTDVDEVDLYAGTNYLLTVMAEFADGHSEDVTDEASYSSDNEDVATVQNGVITAVSAGDAQITITFQGLLGEEQTATVDVTVEEGYTVFLEAECGEVGDDWQTIGSTQASNGFYVTVTPGTESVSSAPNTAQGLVKLPFDLDDSATYSVFLRMNGPSANDDSFWVQFDDEAFTLYNGLVTSGWQWVKLDDYSLRRRDRVLSIGYREDGALLDKIAISNVDAAPQGMGGEAVNICTITSNKDIEDYPNEYELGQNYPNPFNPNTQINYSLPESGLVTINVINAIGQKVATLVNETKSAGRYQLNFDASTLSSGVYFYTLSVGDYNQTRKMLLIK